MLYPVTDDNYSNNANPNITWGQGSVNRFLLTYEKHAGSNQGINWIYGEMEYCGVYPPSNYSGPNWVPGTSSSSINATVNLNKHSDYSQGFNVVYQDNNSIRNASLNCISGNPRYNGTQTLSSSTGRWNYQPSMIQMQNSYIRVCWIRDQMGDPRNSPYAVNTVYWDEASSSYTMMGFKAQSISLNIRDDNARTFYAYSDYSMSSNGLLNHVSNNSSIVNLNTTGRDIQLSNGPLSGSSSNMVMSAFNTSSSPYYFQNAGAIGNLLQKGTPDQMTYGRGGTIVKGDMAFSYIFGNLIVDKNSIDFVDAPDSLKYNNLDTVNSVLVTQPFSVTNKSKIVFVENCGFIDSAAAAKSLKNGEYIAYKVELLNDATGKVLGTIKGKTFDSSNANADKMVPYLLNAKELGSKTVRAKITITTNIDSAKIALMKNYSNADLTNGTSTQSIELQSIDIVTTYALGQNYPNPFNPSTIINYQIPNDGQVTLKVYDVLGREVKTLVNEFKQVGRYSVTLDASSLATGVYFYRLTSGNYVSTRKMLMMK
jgi:hypothetical protein